MASESEKSYEGSSQRSSLLEPQSSLLEPRSSLLEPRNSLLEPRSSLLEPRNSLLDQLSESSERSSLLDLPAQPGKRNPKAFVRPLSARINAQWTATFYESVQQRALHLQEARVQKLHRDKVHEKKVEEKEPPDQLCKEWFNDESVTLETRTYLLDKLLPTLVPGVEKLLKVAERKKALEAAEFEPLRFDPLNFLGEYLMRNNPAYALSAMPNPYMRGMKAVTDELKAQVPETTMHKLAQMKTLVKEKRQQREEVKNIKSQVTDMRKEALGVQFSEWTLDASGQIPLALVQSALRSFLEVVTAAPADETEIYARSLEAVGTLEVKLNEEQFQEYVLSYTKTFTSDRFQELLKHFLQCANDTRDLIRHDIWRQMFVQLFLDCDHGKIGLLDRQRILMLLETFYDSCSELIQKGFCNPRKWPVAELEEIALAEFWGDMEDEETSERRSVHASSVLGLSEEALVLNVILKEILSDTWQATPGTSSIPPQPPAASQEEAASGSVSAAAAATASRDRMGTSAASLKPSQPGLPVEQGPAVETGAPAAEEMVLSATEVAIPQAQPSGSDLAADGTAAPESPEIDSPSQLAAIVGDVLEEKELSPEQQVAAKASLAEPASGLGEEAAAPEQKTEAEEPAVQEEAEAGRPEQPRPSTEAHHATAQASLLSPPAQKASEICERPPQLIYGKPWSGDLPTADLTLEYSDYGKEVREDWNHENSRFPDLRMNMIEIQARGPPSRTSAFDKSSLNLPQFVQLMETFVGDDVSMPSLEKLVAFVKENYMQTEEEKISQLETVHHNSFLVRQQLLLAALFEKWDNECSGFLDMEEVDAILSTFKEGMEEEALNKAKLQLPIPLWHPSGVVKLTLREFQAYIELVVSELTGNEDEVLDNVVEFLMMTVEQTHTERLRGSARRKWLHGIQQAARTSGGCLEPVYQAVFRTLCRDADAHGDGKRICAYIALLEFNLLFPERGDILLRYVACTEYDAPHVLNQILYMDMKGVSFAAVLDDKPIHIPRVQLHGNIHFWNPEAEKRGSFLVVPLEDIRRRVFGILGLDTLRDHSKKTIFVPHEIRFYQMHDYTLRKVMTSDLKGQADIHVPPGPVFSRKENVFRDYLFKCIDCAEVVAAWVYEEHHVAIPLRDVAGQAIAVFDLSLGDRQKLPSCEHKDLQKMLKMVQAATCEILKEDSGDLDPYYVLEAEYVGDWRRGGVLFYRFMLQDLQNCICSLDPWFSFGEIRCFQHPPILVHSILKAVLLILYPQWAGTEEIENWNYCIQKLDGDLIENICYFDPTAAYVQTQPEVLYRCLRGAQRRDVWKFGSAPMEYLYNWTLTCLALIELAKKLQHSQGMKALSSSLLQSSLPPLVRSSDILANTKRSLSLP
ncbi:EF-hand calcium-binding domain-containing protein 5 isoform X2 [Hemicordylus capensis]|uniref:EF-hand calcium-binding domain-containing protein 5 isoform X2 n=1 Tax=Hemicordylus capensis TaxID=884348 RepID=UPI0023049949|nr:EF-hand calcium-binding domain-containing protein 5 isoform X2 [Hemicordylus capensis]